MTRKSMQRWTTSAILGIGVAVAGCDAATLSKVLQAGAGALASPSASPSASAQPSTSPSASSEPGASTPMPAPLDTVKPSGAPIVAPSDAPTTVPSDAPSDGPVSISYGVDRNTLYLKLLTDEASPGLLVTLPDTGRFIANWQGFSYRDIEFINENPDIVDFGTEAGEGMASGLEGSYSWPIKAKAPGYAIIGIKNTITSESYTQGVTVLDGGALAVDVK